MEDKIKKCELCELKVMLHTYDDSDPRWIIIDCMNCLLPMSVWRGEPSHTMYVDPVDYQEMEEALLKVARKKFGNEDFYIDKKQNEVIDHLHWHARPNDWKPRKLRWRIKNKIRNFYRKCTNTKQN